MRLPLAAQPELVTPVLQGLQRVLTLYVLRDAELKTPWRDGSTHLVMSPLGFMRQLAALVPRPWLHLIRYFRPLPRPVLGRSEGA